ncbi:hypothetical protein [Aliivibrio fischeri]|nr:hypothetical protein [Aliivibrio fischeri]
MNEFDFKDKRSEERQETTRERAARQRLERRAELTVTPEDEARWAENRERVLAERKSRYVPQLTPIEEAEVEIETEGVSLLETLGILEDVKFTLRRGYILLVGETHSKTHGRELCLEIMETGLVSCICLEFDSQLLSLDSDSIDELEEVINIIEMAENSPMGHHCLISMQQIKKKALECNVKIKLVDNQKYKGNKRQRFLARSIKTVLNRHNESGKGVLVLIGSDHLKDITERGRHSWQSLQYHLHSEFLPNYRMVQHNSGLVYIQV